MHYRNHFKQWCREVGVIYILAIAVVFSTFLLTGLDELHSIVHFTLGELTDLDMPPGYPGTHH